MLHGSSQVKREYCNAILDDVQLNFLVRHLVHHPPITERLGAQALVSLIDEHVVHPVVPQVL